MKIKRTCSPFLPASSTLPMATVEVAMSRTKLSSSLAAGLALALAGSADGTSGKSAAGVGWTWEGDASERLEESDDSWVDG